MIKASIISLWYQQLMGKYSIGSDHIASKGTTLNEYFSSGNPDRMGRPTLNLVTLGNFDCDPEEYGYANSIHLATDAKLLSHVPFAIRKEDDDLTGTESSKYRLRVIRKYGGENYVFYYAKVVAAESIRDNILTIERDGDAYELTPILTESINTYRDDNVFEDRFDEGKYITSITNLNIVLTVADIDNIKNAIDTLAELTNKPANYLLTEMGVCTSISDGGKESDSVQLAIMSNINLDVSHKLESDLLSRLTLGGMTYNNHMVPE